MHCFWVFLQGEGLGECRVFYVSKFQPGHFHNFSLMRKSHGTISDMTHRGLFSSTFMHIFPLLFVDLLNDYWNLDTTSRCQGHCSARHPFGPISYFLFSFMADPWSLCWCYINCSRNVSWNSASAIKTSGTFSGFSQLTLIVFGIRSTFWSWNFSSDCGGFKPTWLIVLMSLCVHVLPFLGNSHEILHCWMRNLSYSSQCVQLFLSD